MRFPKTLGFCLLSVLAFGSVKPESVLTKLRGVVTDVLSSSASSSNSSLAKKASQVRDGPRSISDHYETIDQDIRIPFWNIAHMVNSIEQVDQALSNGSNGIEVDVSFDERGFPTESYHGFPCDCGRHCHYRENFVDFVRYIAKISVPPASSNLQLILFDLKLKDLKQDEQRATAGESLARILHENLYAKYARVVQSTNSAQVPLLKPPVRIIISINHVTDRKLIMSFIDYIERNRLDSMKQLVGFDVGMNDELKDVSLMWKDLRGITNNIWQGDGLTNCANLVRGIERLKEAIKLRNDRGHFRKIYYWTVDIMYQMRAVVRLGLDAILTNQPKRVLQLLEEPEFKARYRLATHYDDPFAQYWIQPSAWKMPLPSIDEAKETLSNIKQTSENFVKGIPDGLNAAFKKFQSSLSKDTRSA